MRKASAPKNDGALSSQIAVRSGDSAANFYSPILQVDEPQQIALALALALALAAVHGLAQDRLFFCRRHNASEGFRWCQRERQDAMRRT
jgi:hypothetical protein